MRKFALRLILMSSNDGKYKLNGSHVFDKRSKNRICSYVTKRWIQSFVQNHGILPRCQSCKLLLYPGEQEFLEREPAFYLGSVAKAVSSGLLTQ